MFYNELVLCGQKEKPLFIAKSVPWHRLERTRLLWGLSAGPIFTNDLTKRMELVLFRASHDAKSGGVAPALQSQE